MLYVLIQVVTSSCDLSELCAEETKAFQEECFAQMNRNIVSTATQMNG